MSERMKKLVAPRIDPDRLRYLVEELALDLTPSEERLLAGSKRVAEAAAVLLFAFDDLDETVDIDAAAQALRAALIASGYREEGS